MFRSVSVCTLYNLEVIPSRGPERDKSIIVSSICEIKIFNVQLKKMKPVKIS